MTLISDRYEKRNGNWYGLFQCACGQKHIARTMDVKVGRIKSCGCGPKTNFRHGMTNSPEYSVWTAMKKRCLNKNHPDYYRYGGRGIKICKDWILSFEKFYADMGNRPNGYTLDRIDNDKGYEPNNCRWATLEVQSNNKRNNKKFEIDGQSKTVDQWARQLGLNRDSIWNRIKRGKTIHQSIEEVTTKQKQGLIKCKIKNQ